MNFEFHRLIEPIHGDCVSLFPLEHKHFDDLYRWGSDPKVWEQHPESNRFERPMFEKFFAAAIDSLSAFAIVDLTSGGAVGTTRYYPLGEDEAARYKSFLLQRSVCIGYTFLARPFWGTGMNQSVKELMLRRAFDLYDQVVFQVGASNRRSQIALEKIGALKQDIVDHLDNLNGTKDPHYVYLLQSSNNRLR